MNSIFKKDVMKIREIQAHDWDKQCQQAPTNLKGSKILKVTNIKEQPESTIRSKNYSYTGPSVTGNTDQQLKNYQVHPKPLISTEITRTNFPSSKINFGNEPKASTKFNLDLDLSKVTNYGKKYKQNLYATERSERPITDIIKKKYML